MNSCVLWCFHASKCVRAISRASATTAHKRKRHQNHSRNKKQNSVITSTRQLSIHVRGPVETIDMEPRLLTFREIENHFAGRRKLSDNRAKAEFSLYIAPWCYETPWFPSTLGRQSWWDGLSAHSQNYRSCAPFLGGTSMKATCRGVWKRLEARRSNVFERRRDFG